MSIPAAGTVTTSGDRIASGTVHTLTALDTAGSVVMAVTRYVALVAAETHTTLTLTAHWVADCVASTLAMARTVLTVAAPRTRCHHIHTHITRRWLHMAARGAVLSCSKPAFQRLPINRYAYVFRAGLTIRGPHSPIPT